MTVKREVKLKARLDNYVREYTVLEKSKKDLFRQAHLTGDYSATNVITLKVIQERIDTITKQICICVARLISADVSIDNEIALQVYDLASSNRLF